MMEWTHWATRMHPSVNAGDGSSSPYTADQRETIKAINDTISLNTLSRIWQVMVAAVPELQASSNQKQCFDMLVIRLMHIADMPSIPELLEQQEKQKRHADASLHQGIRTHDKFRLYR
jgi:DNA polymerase-3 subunit gamma/tau